MSQHAQTDFRTHDKKSPPLNDRGRQICRCWRLNVLWSEFNRFIPACAEYVVDILKGAKPGDLPVKLASRFEIFINLKTSQQLGVVIPQHVLVQADKIIK